jgi:hypothetical protein
MSAKNFIYLPEVTYSSARNEDIFKDITGVAIPVSQGEKVSIKKVNYLNY